MICLHLTMKVPDIDLGSRTFLDIPIAHSTKLLSLLHKVSFNNIQIFGELDKSHITQSSQSFFNPYAIRNRTVTSE